MPYVTNEDISPIRCSALIGKMIKGLSLEQRAEAVEYMRKNAIVREFVSMLILSQQRVASKLKQIASDIS